MRNRQVYGLDAQRPVLATEIAAHSRQLLLQPTLRRRYPKFKFLQSLGVPRASAGSTESRSDYSFLAFLYMSSAFELLPKTCIVARDRQPCQKALKGGS